MSNKQPMDPVKLGEAIKSLMNTDVGKYIEAFTSEDIEEAKNQLFAIEPYKFTTLVDLQNAIQEIKAKANASGLLRDIFGVAIVNANQVEHINNPED